MGGCLVFLMIDRLLVWVVGLVGDWLGCWFVSLVVGRLVGSLVGWLVSWLGGRTPKAIPNVKSINI